MEIEEVNLVAVLVAALLSMAIGFMWYSLKVFGKPWMREVGLSEKDLRKGPGGGYALVMLTSLVQAFVLAQFIDMADAETWLEGAQTGFWLWAGFVATAYAVTYVFTQKTFRLWTIDTGYFLTLLIVQGAVLAAWA